MKEWTISDYTGGIYLGGVEVIGVYFQLLQTKTRLIFGGACNSGFLESGYIERKKDEDNDKLFRELVEELETYYSDGGKYCNRIIYNERM